MISARTRLQGADLDYYALARLADAGYGDPSRLPMTIKVLLEGLLRQAETGRASESSVRALTRWPEPPPEAELPYLPSRILLQDFTGVPAVVDLAAMRSAMERAGKDAGRIDPLVPVDLVVDHSVQVDVFGNTGAYARNIEREYARNGERYALLRWAQQAFHNFTVVPPGMGICHQVNLERLSRVVQVRKDDRGGYALPDTLLGTDSHTTMVNGVGVLGWGVGGIEAEAALLGQPTYLPTPVVIGVRMTGALRPGATATDLVLTLTEMLRKRGVVNKFVEFCGAGLSTLSVPDRATLSNMCPEYGATSALFPVDHQTLRYLEVTGRDREQIELVERYTKEQGLFRVDGAPAPKFTELLELDLGKVEPSVAGPKRPQDRVALPDVWKSFTTVFAPGPKPDPGAISRLTAEGGPVDEPPDGRPVMLSELWPTQEEVNAVIQQCVKQEMFKREYARIFEGDEHWKTMSAPTGPTFAWDPSSTYVKEPPYFEEFSPRPAALRDIDGARVLAVLGDSVTTDHISPAGSIPVDSPAGRYLIANGVDRFDFNSFGARRGNHEVMERGTFGNIRLRNALASREGYFTKHFPDGVDTTIFEAAQAYKKEGVPLLVLAGKEYGTGSSRDWAAKGPLLLGVRAVIAESFERIHRSNLVGMGILPLQFGSHENAQLLGLTGQERYTVRGLDALKPGQLVEVRAVADDGPEITFHARARVDNETEIGYLHHGGILPLVLRQLMAK